MLSLTELYNVTFSGIHGTCYLLSFGNLFVNTVHFVLTENVKRYKCKKKLCYILSLTEI